MLTIACVLRSGGIYNPGWVARLKCGVAKHLPSEHRFICLSDVDVPCERIPLIYDWPGWWAKIEILKIPGPILFLDLDTLITGDLSDIAAAAVSQTFAALRDPYRPDFLGSGMMSWSASDTSPLAFFECFREDPWKWQDSLRGDQDFINEISDLPAVLRWQDLVPGQIVSYKADNCYLSAPRGARIVYLHGKPKFRDMPADNWARVEWEGLAG